MTPKTRHVSLDDLFAASLASMRGDDAEANRLFSLAPSPVDRAPRYVWQLGPDGWPRLKDIVR